MFLFYLFAPSACYIFFILFYLCCVFAVRAGGVWSALGLRRSVCGVFSVWRRRLWPVGLPWLPPSGLAGLVANSRPQAAGFGDLSALGRGRPICRSFPCDSAFYLHTALGLWLPVLVGLPPGVWASSGCCSSGSSWAGGALVPSPRPLPVGFQVFLVYGVLMASSGPLLAWVRLCLELCASSGWFSGLLCLRAGGKHRPRTRREDSETQES